MTDTTKTRGRHVRDRHGRTWFMPTTPNHDVQPVGHNEPPTELRLFVEIYGPFTEVGEDGDEGRSAAGAADRYAWCFSHGRMHTFPVGREPWCTAWWVPLAGNTEQAALAEKRNRYGDAQFMHHLSVEQQAAIVGDGA